MNKKIIAGVALAAVLALGYEAKKEYNKAYKNAEVAGCIQTVIYDVEQRYGQIPDDVKGKVVTQIDKECRQIL